MKNVLVTGGAGFIGSNFTRFLLGKEPGINIFNLDALTYAGSLENLKDLPNAQHHHFIHGDICDLNLVSRLIKEHHIDTIVHFAAESHVDRSIHAPGQFIQTNINGTFNLLEAARMNWFENPETAHNKRFHHVSTDEVFGALSPADPAFNESTPYAPRSPYSASKASSDHLVRAYYHTYHLPVTLSNCTNNYGPYQFPEKLIPLMILNALEGKNLPVYGDGRQIRDWLYVEDHCEAIYRILEHGKIGETYAIGGNNQPGNLEIIETICSILDKLRPDSSHIPHSHLIQYVTDRPGHDRRYAMDISRIHNELGWSPAKDLQSGLYETVLWYLNHPDWIAAIRDRKDYTQWMESNYTKR